MVVYFQDLNIKHLQGLPVDLADLSLAASTMTRLASRIGLERVARDVTFDQLLDRRKALADQDIIDRLDDLHGK